MSFKSHFTDKFGFCCQNFHSESALPELTAEEQAILSPAASPKRRREFAFGRHVAREALRAVGYNPAPAVLRGTAREPAWPPGVVGSLSHCDGAAAALVTKEPSILAIGIDLERLSDRRSDISAHIAGTDELAWINSAAERAQSTLLLFSAKESFYKATYPITGKYLGFKDVRIVPDASLLVGELLVDLTPHFEHGYRFHVRYAWEEALLMTWIILERA